MKRAILFVFLAAVLGGCAANRINLKYTALPTEPQPIGTSFTATPPAGWYRVTSDLDRENQTNWAASNRGTLTDLRFWYDLEDGDALFDYVDPDFPLFRSDMTPADVMDMYREVLELRNLLDIETTNLRPAAFGALEGFRFETSYWLPNNRAVQGTVLAAIVGKKLQMIAYINYPNVYDEKVGDANAIFNSVELQ